MDGLIEPDLAALRADVEALAALVRDSAGPGERASAELVARRLEAAGARDVRIEPFRYQRTYAGAHAAHAAAGLLAARIGGAPGAALALAAGASLEREVSGRDQWLRRLLPAGEGANVVARVPAGDAPRGTLVLVAHHDAARTGLFWRSPLVRLGAARRRATRRIEPFMAPTAAGFALVAAGALAGRHGRAPRAAGAALLALSLGAAADIARSPTVPGASDNATGVAALLALAAALARERLAGVDVLLVAPGCEESGMGGMAAFLRAHGAALDPRTTLVLGLDTLGAGAPIVASGEGAIRTYRYRRADLALADAGAAHAGLAAPARWRLGGWTDPILAVLAGLPAISLLSIGPQGTFTDYHLATDTPERVDWRSVASCVALAGGIVRAFAERHAPPARGARARS